MPNTVKRYIFVKNDSFRTDLPFLQHSYTWEKAVDYPPQISFNATMNGTIATLQATATDDKRVTKVEFWMDDTLISTDTTAPYETQINLSSHPRKYAYLYAVAFDEYVIPKHWNATITGGSPGIQGEDYDQRAYSQVVEVGPFVPKAGVNPVSTPVLFSSSVNTAPQVNAGVDQTIPSGGRVFLQGTVLDDGLPSGILTVQWSKVSGPGTVTFDNASSFTPAAQFSASGTYRFNLTVSDGALQGSDEMVVVVQPPLSGIIGLLAKWQLDEGAGSLMSDSSGNSKHAPLVGGPTWVQGRVDGALMFDGVDDWVDLTHNKVSFGQSGVNLNLPLSIALWFNPSRPYTAQNNGSFSLLGLTGSGQHSLGYFGGFLRWEMDGGGAQVNRITYQTNFQPDTWYHLVVTYDGSQQKMYLNGQEVGSRNTPFHRFTSIVSVNTRTGLNPGDGLAGAIDEVRVYSRAISPAEVLALAQASSIPPGIPTLSSLSLSHLFLDSPRKVSLMGSNLSLTDTFNITLQQGTSTPLSFLNTIPKDTTTIELDFPSKNLSFLTLGSYNLEVIRSTNPLQPLLQKSFLLTKLGDLPDTQGKRDAKIDLDDVSRLLSTFGKAAGATGFNQEADINPGPANVSSGKVDIFDANKLMTNWTG